jgi:hypothetical protein
MRSVVERRNGQREAEAAYARRTMIGDINAVLSLCFSLFFSRFATGELNRYAGKAAYFVRSPRRGVELRCR